MFARHLLICLFLAFAILSGCREQTKEPAVAGQYYPAEEAALREMVDGFLKQASAASGDGELVALISPHAGYVFSGHVAAHGYKLLKKTKTVIVIGASHYHDFKGASVYTKGSFKTPLGSVKIDTRLAESFLNKEAFVGFYPEVYEKEHAIEVQIPFLQRVLQDFKIVPIMTGMLTRETTEHLYGKLTSILARDESVVLVASTDLSHYHDYSAAMAMDKAMAGAIARMSLSDIEKLLATASGEMCGIYPVTLTLRIARGLGANSGVILKYANSGDVTSDKGKVVGYASIGLFRTKLTDEEKEQLLDIARQAVAQYVLSGKLYEPEVSNPKFLADGAVFVTITKNGELRGCIGHMDPVMPLYKSIVRNAISASSMDPRFPPMTESELREIDVEISVLSPLVPVGDAKEIQIGRDGLFIVKDMHSGILLPQVPVQYGWDVPTFLKEVCFKAGLPEDAWKTANLYRFTAEVIH